MIHRNQFVIQNNLSASLLLNIEPEGAFFPLGLGDEVTITDTFTTDPVSIKLESSNKGDPILTIWPGDGEVRVEKNGIDVLDLLQEGVEV